MRSEYGISPDVEYYACLVDNLARAGWLNEAYTLIKSMPMQPDDCVWVALLSGCQIHGNVPLAEVAARHLVELKPQHSGYHVLLSNIYTDASGQKDAAHVRTVMKDMGVKKFPGYSWIEVNGEFHTFLTADKTHEQRQVIYFTLDGLTKRLLTELGLLINYLKEATHGKFHFLLQRIYQSE
ncbi:Pentatricopeptide repeat-containing protein, partial [Thalictrum thalictroides]